MKSNAPFLGHILEEIKLGHVWDVIENRVPVLKIQIENLLNGMTINEKAP